jgi:hypothetical protein
LGGHIQAGYELDIALNTADRAFLDAFSLSVGSQLGPFLLQLLLRLGFVPHAKLHCRLNVDACGRFRSAISVDIKGGHMVAGIAGLR